VHAKQGRESSASPKDHQSKLKEEDNHLQAGRCRQEGGVAIFGIQLV